MHYGPKTVTGEMVAMDALNPKSGSSWTDMGSSASAITHYNTPTHSANGYFTLDGVNEYLRIGNTNYPAAWTDDFSIELWMHYATGNNWNDRGDGTLRNSWVVGRGAYNGGHGICRKNSGTDVLRAWIRSSPNSDGSGATIKTADASITGRDEWNHVVMTYDDDVAMILYINGAVGDTESNPNYGGTMHANYPPGNDYWSIGQNRGLSGSYAAYYDGRLAFIKIYKKALTAAEVLQNFNATRGRFGV